MSKILRIGTRESQLAVWQATCVQNLLKQAGIDSQLVYIKSEGDLDTVTPLYALGVQGVFTRTLDAALLDGRIDIAVHSMKDVPVQLAQGIQQASVLKRGSYKDIFVYKEDDDLGQIGFVNGEWSMVNNNSRLTIDPARLSHSGGDSPRLAGGRAFTIATSSIRRIAQWLNRYPDHKIENLRGNVNTRLRKLQEHDWNGAIFAAAGLERIDLRPANSIELDWMLPAPAQGAIMVVCRKGDEYAFQSCQSFNDEPTAMCARIERDFLKTLLGGCSTPISALAIMLDDEIYFKGNILSPDGREKLELEKTIHKSEAMNLGEASAIELLSKGGQKLVDNLRNA